MQNTVLKTFKPIQNFMKNNNFLSGEIKVTNDIPTIYIPICSVSVHKFKKEQMYLNFDTLDVNTGNISNVTYNNFIYYLSTLEHEGSAFFDRHHNQLPYAKRIVDFIRGSFILPSKAIRYQFTLAGKHFYILKFLSKNEHEIILLYSSDTDRAWLNRLGINNSKLTRYNLAHIFTLLKSHLLFQPNALKISTRNYNSYEKISLNSFRINNHQIILVTDSGKFKISLNRAKAYFDSPVNANSRLTFEYKNKSKSKFKISIIFASQKVNNLINIMTRK